MTPYYEDSAVTIYCGDCRDVLPHLSDIETCVTDPPYGLSFMGKDWDHGVPGVEFWRLISDALLPGAMCLAFGGTRTFHRLTCAIEDAGFEIRDCLMWLYGSGFPKSLDISKAIDRRPGVTLHDEFVRDLVAARKTAGLSRADVSEAVVGTRSGACWNWEHHQYPEARHWSALKACLPAMPDKWGAVLAEAEREKVGERDSGLDKGSGASVDFSGSNGRNDRGLIDITAPATAAAQLWHGWGTALKPAWEPIVLAMKPVLGTFAQNAQVHGVAGLNIDGCRIGTERPPTTAKDFASWRRLEGRDDSQLADADTDTAKGRWPANVLLDEDAARLLDEQSGVGVSGYAQDAYTQEYERTMRPAYGDVGGASRFFYTAKASRSDRGPDNTHPTVKPTDLMKWLVKLTATPTGGTVLDPFMGSGTTVYAAKEMGRKAIGIELDEKWCEVAAKRCQQEVLPL